MSRMSLGQATKVVLPARASHLAARSFYPVGMLLAVLTLAVTRETAILAASAVLGIGVLTFRARDRWTSAGAGALGWANTLTWLRIVACAYLLISDVDNRLKVLVAFAIFALDGLDGAIARYRKTSSAFGAELDKECDGFYVLSLAVLLWLSLIAGPWVLIAGLWRYVYLVAMALGDGVGAQAAPRSAIARYTYSSSSILLMAALYPGNPIALQMAALATLLISASFTRSLYYAFSRT